MRHINTVHELQAELREILQDSARAQPSRAHLANKLAALADRVAVQKTAGVDTIPYAPEAIQSLAAALNSQSPKPSKQARVVNDGFEAIYECSGTEANVKVHSDVRFRGGPPMITLLVSANASYLSPTDAKRFAALYADVVQAIERAVSSVG